MGSKKKYQIFISSTFTDMKAERQAAVEAILNARHIPAGMELFTAGDETQLDVIKRWIRDSDIFLLILGARYGSLDTNDGRSYTEIEYDYAVEIGKPHFALVLSPAALAIKERELRADDVPLKDQDKLEAFRQKVKQKMVRFDHIKDIRSFVPESIHALEERHDFVGWVKGNEVPILPNSAGDDQALGEKSPTGGGGAESGPDPG